MSNSTPIRHLVITGKDTPENNAKFVGRNDQDQIKKTHQDARIRILLRPPPGSPNWAMAKNLKLDENCPAWTPRPASTEEDQGYAGGYQTSHGFSKHEQHHFEGYARCLDAELR